MTREEAIHRLKNAAWLGTNDERNKTEEAVDMAISALEQEPCEDAISRSTAKTRIYLKYVNRLDICKAMFKILDGVPSVQPSRKGHWIKSDLANEKFNCSVCGGACWYYDYQGTVAKSKFCPNCGAKMK